MKISDQLKQINTILTRRLQSGKKSAILIHIERSKAVVSDFKLTKLCDVKGIIDEEKYLMG